MMLPDLVIDLTLCKKGPNFSAIVPGNHLGSLLAWELVLDRSHQMSFLVSWISSHGTVSAMSVSQKHQKMC